MVTMFQTSVCAFLTTIALLSTSVHGASILPAGFHRRFLRAARLPAEAPTPYNDFDCVTRNFTQKLDHFNGSDTRTFNQLIYVCPKAWPTDPATAAKNGSLFVFLGNEAPLTNIAQPIIFENAVRKNALILEVEHRYYGQSVPFEPQPISNMLLTPQYKYLTVEQVMADTKAVVESIRQEFNINNTRVPTLVVGGSYGGDISAYHRFTYPDTFQAAISASAPFDYIFSTSRMTDTQENYHRIIAKAVDHAMNGSTLCRTTARQGMDVVRASDTNATARQEIAQKLGLCNAATALVNASSVDPLLMNLYDPYVGSVQLNGQKPFPTYVNTTCAAVEQYITANPGDYVGALAAGYRAYNESGPGDCLSFNMTYFLITNPYNDTAGYAGSYSYQQCTQYFVTSSECESNGENGTILPVIPVTADRLRQECEQAYGADVPEGSVPPVTQLFYSDLPKLGQVVMTNGDMDAWGGGSILSDEPGVKMATVIYQNASHCTDTHSYNWNNPVEPPVYKQQRAEAVDAAAVWMEQYRNGTNPPPSWGFRITPPKFGLLFITCLGMILA